MMNGQRYRSCAAAFVVFSAGFWGASHQAFAAGPSATPPRPQHEDEEKGKALARKAYEAGDAKRFSEAADYFGQAWALYKEPAYVCNQGAMLEQAKRYRDAAGALTICLRMWSTASGLPMKSVVEQSLRRVRRHVGMIDVVANMPGAEILVDSHVVGTTPLDDPLFLDPGEHVVEARAPGYDPDARSVDGIEGSYMEVDMKLTETSKLGILMDKPAKLPDRSSEAICASLGFTAGPKPSGIKSVEYSNGSASTSGQSGSSSNSVMIVSGLAIAAAGAALGVGLLVVAAGNRSDANTLESAIAEKGKDYECTGATPDLRCGTVDSYRNNATMFTVFGVGSLVLAAGGGALAAYGIVQGRSPSASNGGPKIAAGASSDGAMVLVSGTF